MSTTPMSESLGIPAWLNKKTVVPSQQSPAPMTESLGMPAGMLPPPEPPITSPNQGFGAWASDQRNMEKVTPYLMPQPEAPGVNVNPEAASSLFSDTPPPSVDTNIPTLPKIDLGMPQTMATAPSQQQDQQNYPDVYGKPYLKDGQLGVKNRIAGALMGFGGGMRGNPMVGADYIHGLQQHDLNLTGQNQQIYNQRFIQPQLDAQAVPAAQARVANTQAQTAHMNAETQAMINPAAPMDKHIGSYENADGKNVDKWQDAKTGKEYETVSGDIGHKDTAAPSTPLGLYNAQFKKEHGRDMTTAEILAYDRQHAQAIHVNTGGSEGTWSLVEGPDGKPVLFNSKTAQTKPAPDIEKAGTYTKGKGAATDAMNYADLYKSSGKFTGPGDEALMEKFFELAKPSSGFRMSQPQMDMLKNSKDWMTSAEGIAYHAETGAWFPPKQREQIMDTMHLLGQSKGVTPSPTSQEKPVRDKQGKLLGYTTDGKTFSRSAD